MLQSSCSCLLFKSIHSMCDLYSNNPLYWRSGHYLNSHYDNQKTCRSYISTLFFSDPVSIPFMLKSCIRNRRYDHTICCSNLSHDARGWWVADGTVHHRFTSVHQWTVIISSNQLRIPMFGLITICAARPKCGPSWQFGMSEYFKKLSWSTHQPFNRDIDTSATPS